MLSLELEELSNAKDSWLEVSIWLESSLMDLDLT
jgi:hypothetical protein